ncbi:MAG: hypothetical protein U0175_25685 [Caldilineaceae bacterium]
MQSMTAVKPAGKQSNTQSSDARPHPDRPKPDRKPSDRAGMPRFLQGTPPANGKTTSATDQKDAAQKVAGKKEGESKDEAKQANEKEAAKGEGKAGDAAKAGDQAGKAAPGAEGAEGEGGQPLPADPQAATDTGDVTPQPITPPAPLRIQPLFPPFLAAPPTLEDRARVAITKRTGLTPQEHYQQTERRLDEIVNDANSRRMLLVSEFETKASSTVGQFSVDAVTVQTTVSQAETAISEGYAQARVAVNSTTDNAISTAQGQVEDGRAQVTTNATTQTKTVSANHQQASDQIQNLYNLEIEPFRKMLATGKEGFETAAKGKAKEMTKTAASFAAKVDVQAPDSPVEDSRNETKAKTATQLGEKAATDMTTGGSARGQATLAQEAAFGQIILGYLRPLSGKAMIVGDHGVEMISAAEENAMRRLQQMGTESQGDLKGTREAVLQRLDKAEKAAKQEVRAAGKQLEIDISKQAQGANDQLHQTSNALIDEYGDYLTNLGNNIKPPEGFINYRDVEPTLRAAPVQIQAMFDAHLNGLNQTHATSVGQLRQSVSARLESLRSVGENARDEAMIISGKQEEHIQGAAQNFAQGAAVVSGSVNRTVDTFVAPTGKKLDTYLKQVRAELKTLREGTEKELKTRKTDYEKEMQGNIDGFAQSSGKALKDASLKLDEDLDKRGDKAFDAMRGIGTDEASLMDALRSLTFRQGKALRVIWDRHIDPGETLESWLDGELSGDEYDAAFAYLNGNTAAGARFELEASMRWYGDDEARIENVLRSLSDEDRAKLKNEPGWKETSARLTDNLSGTDLQVTDALLEGKRFRADALRLRERVDEARHEGNTDKVHELLAGIPPSDLAQVQQEFAHIEGKVNLDAGGKIDQKQAANMLAEYVVRPVETYDPKTGQVQKVSMTGSKADLAMALARSGEGSLDAKVSRLAVETERSGGAKLENLETALNDPRLRDKDPKVVAQAQIERQQLISLFAERYSQSKNKGDPKAARAFAEEKLRGALDDNLSQEMALGMLDKGRADPAVAIKFAVKGVGTNEELIKRTLRTMDRDEIKAMSKAYKDRFDVDLEDDLGTNGHGGFFTELSGDDRLEVERLLLGQPRNDRERVEVAQLAARQQREETGFAGRGLMSGSPEDRALAANTEGLSAQIEKLGGMEQAFDKDGNFKGDVAELRRYTRFTQSSAENYAAQIDRIGSYITTAIAIAGAVALAVLSGGTATPLLAAAIAGGTGLLTVGANYALRGGRYGWEAAATDTGIAAVQAATAGLGAYMGQVSRISSLTGSKLGDIALIGATTSALNAAGQTALSDGTWENGIGEGLKKTFGSGLKGGMVGAATSVVGGKFEGSKFGSKLTNSTGFITRGTGKALSGGLGGATGRATELLIDKSTGNFHGDIDDATLSILEAGGRGAGQSFLEGVGEARHARAVAAQQAATPQTSGTPPALPSETELVPPATVKPSTGGEEPTTTRPASTIEQEAPVAAKPTGEEEKPPLLRPAGPEQAEGGGAGVVPPRGTGGGGAGGEGPEPLFPNLTDAEIDAAFGQMGAGPLVHAPAPSGFRTGAGQPDYWGAEPATGMTVQEYRFQAQRGTPRLDPRGQPVPGPRGDIQTRMRIHSPDPTAPPGSPSARGWTVGFEQGNARYSPEAGWFDTRYGTRPDGTAIDVRPYRRGPDGNWIHHDSGTAVTDPGTLHALNGWEQNMASSHIPLFPEHGTLPPGGAPPTVPELPPPAPPRAPTSEGEALQPPSVRPAAPAPAQAQPTGNEPISGEAAYLLGSSFRGNAQPSNQTRTVSAVDEALPKLQNTPIHAEGNARQIEIPTGVSDAKVKVRIETEAPSPDAEFKPNTRLSGKARNVPVAHFEKNADGSYTIKVSEGAHAHHIERALAHELAEIKHIESGGRRTGGDALAAGSQQKDLSAHDVGRIAELDVIAKQIQAAKQQGDEALIKQLTEEGQQLVSHLGLVHGDEAATARRALLEPHLPANSEAKALLDPLINGARTNKNLAPGHLLQDEHHLEVQINRVRQRFGDHEHFQEWHEFKNRYRKAIKTSKRSDEDLFNDWKAGYYVGGKGRIRLLLGESHVPSPGFESSKSAVSNRGAALTDAEAAPLIQRRAAAQTKRKQLLAEAEQIRKNSPEEDSSEYRAKIRQADALIPEINQPTEGLGEAAGRAFAAQRGAGNQLESPRTGANALDQVFEMPNPPPLLLIVEAKGGGSTLGTRTGVGSAAGKRVQQGTRAYLESLVEFMDQPNRPASERLLAARIRQALATPGGIEYVEVRQPLGDNGELQAMQVNKFNI